MICSALLDGLKSSSCAHPTHVHTLQQYYEHDIHARWFCFIISRGRISASVFILPIDCANTENTWINRRTSTCIFKCTNVSSLIIRQRAVINYTFVNHYSVYRTNFFNENFALQDSYDSYCCRIISDRIKEASLKICHDTIWLTIKQK